MGNEVNESSLYPRHHVYAIDYYSTIDKGYPSLSGPFASVFAKRMDNEPASK
jgi:hypothetical protein